MKPKTKTDLYFDTTNATSGSHVVFTLSDSTCRKLLGVTANVCEGRQSWALYGRGHSPVQPDKQSQSGCMAEVNVPSRDWCVGEETMSKTDCKAAKDMTEAVS